MALKFSCPNCNEFIVIQHLHVGEEAFCRSCRTVCLVPYDAVSISNDDVKHLRSSNSKDPYDWKPNVLTEKKYDPYKHPKREAAIKKWSTRVWLMIIIGYVLLYLRYRLNIEYSNLEGEALEEWIDLLLLLTSYFSIVMAINVIVFLSLYYPIEGRKMAALQDFVFRIKVKYIIWFCISIVVIELCVRLTWDWL